MSRRKKAGSTPALESPVATSRPTTENPLVFISHDSRDADLAEAFGNLLTDASGGILKSFRSSDKKGTAGIEYGQEWYRAIMQKLDDATDVVALLTSRSLNRPWILYETGVAKGKLTFGDDRVFGIAIGVTLDEAATGPFAQFQNSSDDEDAITGLVLQLIRRHPQAAPREEAVRLQAKGFREIIAKLLKDRKNDVVPLAPKTEDTSVAKFFEEIKVLVRDVPERVANEVGGFRTPKGRRRLRIHPGIFDEMFHHPIFMSISPGMPVLIAVSLIRDECPWVYELGAQFFRAFEGRNSMRAHQFGELLVRTIELTLRGGVSEMMGIYSDETMPYLHHVARMTESVMGHLRPAREPDIKKTATTRKKLEE